MITTIFIILALFITFLINTTIHSFLKKKNPEFPKREIQRLLSSKVEVVMIMLVVILVFGILYINFIYQTSSEKKELAEKGRKALEESKEVISITPEQQKMLDEIKAEAKIDHEKSKTNAKLEILFSSWDGSLPSFVDYIKENMNDPDSFEHVETTFRNDSDGMTVRMKYRGKNGFNATVTQTATCKADYEGTFLYLISNN